MLDRIFALREAAASHGLNMEEVRPLKPESDDSTNNDRELIIDFMSHMLLTQRLLATVESCNDKMKEMANTQIYENTRN